MNFTDRVVPTPFFLPICVIMASFRESWINFLSCWLLLYSFSLLLWLDLIFQTWVTQQMGHGQPSDAFMTSCNSGVTMQKQKCYKNCKKHVFEWLSTLITFAVFDVAPWCHCWRKFMSIRRYCMNLVYFDQHLYTINYTEIMTPILQSLSNFSILLVIRDWVDFKNTIFFYNLLFFFKIRKF